MLLEGNGQLAVMQPPTSRGEPFVQGVLDKGVREFELPHCQLPHQRGANCGLDVVDHRELVDAEHIGEEGRLELASGDRGHGEHTLGLVAQPPHTLLKHRTDGPRHRDGGEIDLRSPSARRVGREHTGLDEVPHELGHEQRIAVGLRAQVRRNSPSVVIESVAGCRLEEGDQVAFGESCDVDIRHSGQGAQLSQQRPELGDVRRGGAVGREQHQPGTAQPHEPTDHQSGVAVGPLDVVEEQEHRAIVGRALHEIGDAFHQQPPTGLRIICLDGRKRTHTRRQGGREASDFPAMSGDVLGQDGGRCLLEVLTQRVAERFIRRGHVLVARAEQHRPALLVGGTSGYCCDRRLPSPGLSPEQHRLHDALECPSARFLDESKGALSADEGRGQRQVDR